MMKRKSCSENICYLSELKKGRRAVVEKIEISDELLRRRLFEMGITRGVAVQIKKIAPLGDPVGIMLRNYELCIRKSELKKILARVVEWKLHLLEIQIAEKLRCLIS